MARVTGKRIRKKKRIYIGTLIVILLAAAGIGLSDLSSSLPDINRIIRLAADKFLRPSADIQSAEPVLRGTVFDRNLRELAVSYQMYSLYVRPAEITNIQGLLPALKELTDKSDRELHELLNGSRKLIEVAANLEYEEVARFLEQPTDGILVQPVEERYYPQHETGGGLVGYMEDGLGLTGMEGSLDPFLQQGAFRPESLAEIDFGGDGVLGKSRVDAVLTIDLDIQQKTEDRLEAYLLKSGTARGAALVMDARNGELLAWAEKPCFDPNYYWHSGQEPDNSPFRLALLPGVYGPLLSKAAAVFHQGEIGEPLLPETVAAPDYGLAGGQIESFSEMVGLYDEYHILLPNDGSAPLNSGSCSGRAAGVLQLTAAAAAVINGGVKVIPHMLDGIYDYERDQTYGRREEDSSAEKRIFSPSMGIRLRRNLLHLSEENYEGASVSLSSAVNSCKQGNFNNYVIQDLLISAIPAKSPSLLLVMVSRQDELFPRLEEKNRDSTDLVGEVKQFMTALLEDAQGGVAANKPPVLDPVHYKQFLINRSTDIQPAVAAKSTRAVMPELRGLSLRKGLQRLDQYDMAVRIGPGGGRIIGQMPSAGLPLQDVDECVLSLESNI